MSKILSFSLLIIAVFLNTSCTSKRKRVRVPIKKTADAGKTMKRAAEKVVVGHKGKGEPELAHWGYRAADGPAKWGGLTPFYIQCSEGRKQSPVDLIWKKPLDEKTVARNYKAVPYEISNTGHSIKLNVSGAGETVIHGQSYSLVQVHFHSPSEHTISGKRYALEAHFVHKNHEGELAVIGALFNVGASNAALARIWKNAPAAVGAKKKVKEMFNPQSLLPSITTHYKYSGSLTTPPCTEGLTWIVYNTPQELSSAELATIRKFYRGNFRPVQNLNERGVENFY